jgi:hypothetical protein
VTDETDIAVIWLKKEDWPQGAHRQAPAVRESRRRSRRLFALVQADGAGCQHGNRAGRLCRRDPRAQGSETSLLALTLVGGVRIGVAVMAAVCEGRRPSRRDLRRGERGRSGGEAQEGEAAVRTGLLKFAIWAQYQGSHRHSMTWKRRWYAFADWIVRFERKMAPRDRSTKIKKR